MEYIALISLYIIMATLIIYDTSLKISNQILLHKLFFLYKIQFSEERNVKHKSFSIIIVAKEIIAKQNKKSYQYKQM